MLRKSYLTAAVIVVTLACTPTGLARDYRWDGPVGGTAPFLNFVWWRGSGHLPEHSEDTVHFSERDETYAVEFRQFSHLNHALYVDKGEVTFLLNGNTYRLLSHGSEYPYSVNVGDAAGRSTKLTLNDGTLRSHVAAIGCEGGTGTIVVAGATIWSNTSRLLVGKDGTGTLAIEDGAQVTAGGARIGDDSGSSGQVTVAGSESELWSSGDLLVGNLGTGTLSIQDGGYVNTDLAAYIGSGGGQGSASGQVTVTGSGSRWSMASDLYVGSAGAGTLTILDSGQVTTGGRTIVGLYQSPFINQVAVTGSGSTWTSDILNVGWEGSGALFVRDGGQVSTREAHLGRFGGSDGQVLVTGSGSTWSNSESLQVGHQGWGVLFIEDGGHVSVDGTLKVHGLDDWVRVDGGTLSVGTLDAPANWRLELKDPVDGSVALTIHEGTFSATIGGTGSLRKAGPNELTLDGPLLYTGTTHVDEGTLNLPNGLARADGGVQIAEGAALRAADGAAVIARDIRNNGVVNGPADNDWLTFNDDATGAGSYTGNVAFSAGFSPGNSPAAVLLENVMLDPTSALRMEIGGAEAGSQFDQLVVSGTAQLGGTLQLDILGDYVLDPAYSYELISGPNTGRFDSVEGLSPGWQVFYTPSRVLLAVPEPSTVILLFIGAICLTLAAVRRRTG